MIPDLTPGTGFMVHFLINPGDRVRGSFYEWTTDSVPGVHIIFIYVSPFKNVLKWKRDFHFWDILKIVESSLTKSAPITDIIGQIDVEMSVYLAFYYDL